MRPITIHTRETNGTERPRPQGAEQWQSGVAHAPTPQLLLFFRAARPAQSAALSGPDIAQLLAVLAASPPQSCHRHVRIDIVGGVHVASHRGLMTRSAVGSPFGSPCFVLSRPDPSTDRQEVK